MNSLKGELGLGPRKLQSNGEFAEMTLKTQAASISSGHSATTAICKRKMISKYQLKLLRYKYLDRLIAIE